jgi:hypothetical protein
MYNAAAEEEPFDRWIHTYLPQLGALFDFEKRVYLPEVAKHYLASASHGQAIMARFALGVWCHQDKFEFDFFEAAAALDQHNKQILMDWMARPIWP